MNALKIPAVVRFVVLSIALSILNIAVASDVTFVRQNSKPKYLPDNSGLCDQIYSTIQERMAAQGVDVAVVSENMPIKRILKLLEVGEADLFCGAGLTDERTKLYLYSELPVYDVSNVIVAHEEESVIPVSFEQIAIDKLVIGAFYGTSSSKWLMSHEEVIVSDNHHSLDNVMELIASKRSLRYFFYHDLGLEHYVRTSGLPIKVMPTKFRTIPQWLLYSRSAEPKHIQMIEDIMRDMTESGELAAIQEQFLSH